MNPGRELDAIIAQKVMGLLDARVVGTLGAVYDFTGSQGMHRKSVPNYSTDIGAAWEVVDAIRYSFGGGLLTLIRNGDDTYRCSFDSNSNPVGYTGETPAHSICLAALKALGVEV